MNKNLLLYLALTASKLFCIILCLGVSILIGSFIHWHIAQESYESVQVTVREGRTIMLSEAEFFKPLKGSENVKRNSTGEKRFPLNDLNPASIYITFFQVLLSLIVGFLMVLEVIRILRSVRDLKTFHNSNVKSFRLLGYFFLTLAALKSLHILRTDQGSLTSFYLDYTSLIFMLSAFIMAEIFKEGQKLAEQDQLTI